MNVQTEASSSSHAGHVARHLEHLSRASSRESIEALLDRTALRWEGGRLKSRSGGDVGPAECTRYLEAVREVLGDAEYMPARVNFVLARCSCLASPVVPLDRNRVR